MGWGIKDLLGRPFDPITDAIDRATREVLHSLGGVFDKVASIADDIYNMVYHTNSAMVTSVRKGDISATLLVLVIEWHSVFSALSQPRTGSRDGSARGNRVVFRSGI